MKLFVATTYKDSLREHIYLVAEDIKSAFEIAFRVLGENPAMSELSEIDGYRVILS